jgi:hypothetical protein
MAIAALDSWVVQDTTIDLDYTVSAGTDRLLVVAIGCEDASACNVTSMTYGGQTMFLISDGTRLAKTSATGGGSDSYAEMWACLESQISAASGTTIDVTMDNGAISEYYIAAGSYEGVDQSGNGTAGTIEQTQSLAITTTTFNVPSVDRTADGLLVHACFTRDNSTFTFTEATERIDTNTVSASLAVADKLITVTETATSPATATANGRGVALSASFFAAAAGDVNVSANTEALTLTENQATITSDVNVNANTEVLTLTENAATIDLVLEVLANTEALTLTENSATITFDVDVQANTEALTLTENQATVSNDIDIQANTESLTLTENAADIIFDVDVQANTEALTLAENAADIILDVNVLANTEALTLAENQATITTTSDVNVLASTETLTLSTFAATIDAAIPVTVPSGGGGGGRRRRPGEKVIWYDDWVKSLEGEPEEIPEEEQIEVIEEAIEVVKASKEKTTFVVDAKSAILKAENAAAMLKQVQELDALMTAYYELEAERRRIQTEDDEFIVMMMGQL